MSLYATVEEDLKKAMVRQDADRLSTLRFLKSALKYAAIEKKQDTLTDADVRQVIQKQIKQRRESIDQFSKGGRQDLADKEAREVAVLEGYLPKQLDDAALEQMIQKAVEEEKASTKKDFGRIMKLLTERLAGQAEAKRISDFLNRVLK